MRTAGSSSPARRRCPGAIAAATAWASSGRCAGTGARSVAWAQRPCRRSESQQAPVAARWPRRHWHDERRLPTSPSAIPRSREKASSPASTRPAGPTPPGACDHADRRLERRLPCGFRAPVFLASRGIRRSRSPTSAIPGLPSELKQIPAGVLPVSAALVGQQPGVDPERLVVSACAAVRALCCSEPCIPS